MYLNRAPFRAGISVFAAILTLTALAAAQTPPPTDFSDIKIKNFGQLDERFYRGAQPREDDFKALAKLGIKTVIDLRDDPKGYEKAAVEASGMRYVNIPMSDKDYPKEDQIGAFLKLVNDTGTERFYVHCAGGRHRTGVMGAVYRYARYHWDYEQVYKEMKAYDFYTRWGHGNMKKYVWDYWQRTQSPGIASSAGGETLHQQPVH